MHHTKESKIFFYILLALTFLLSFGFLRSYLSLIIFAGLIGILFYPLHRKFLEWTGKRNWLALPLSFLTIVIVFLLPFLVAAGLAVQVISDFASRVNASSFADGVSLQWGVNEVNSLIRLIPGVSYAITPGQVVGQMQAAVARLGSVTLRNLPGIGGALFGVIPATFISFYIISAILTHYRKISRYLHQLSPLDDTIDSLYVTRIKSMTLSMVRGTFVIALVQGVLAGLLFWIAGVKYAAFLGLLATIISIIPLGSGVLLIPTGIVLIATGSLWQGIVLIAGSLLVVSNIDNLLRPLMVRKEAHLHPALIILGLFAGIAHFGFLGAIYGPVLMIFFVTTLEVYLKYFRQDLEG